MKFFKDDNLVIMERMAKIRKLEGVKHKTVDGAHEYEIVGPVGLIDAYRVKFDKMPKNTVSYDIEGIRHEEGNVVYPFNEDGTEFNMPSGALNCRFKCEAGYAFRCVNLEKDKNGENQFTVTFIEGPVTETCDLGHVSLEEIMNEEIRHPFVTLNRETLGYNGYTPEELEKVSPTKQDIFREWKRLIELVDNDAHDNTLEHRDRFTMPSPWLDYNVFFKWVKDDAKDNNYKIGRRLVPSIFFTANILDRTYFTPTKINSMGGVFLDKELIEILPYTGDVVFNETNKTFVVSFDIFDKDTDTITHSFKKEEDAYAFCLSMRRWNCKNYILAHPNENTSSVEHLVMHLGANTNYNISSAQVKEFIKANKRRDSILKGKASAETFKGKMLKIILDEYLENK